MRVFVLTLSLLLVGAAHAQYWYDPFGYFYPPVNTFTCPSAQNQYDIGGYIFATINSIATYQQCCQMCSVNSSCAGWGWFGNGTCTLRSTARRHFQYSNCGSPKCNEILTYLRISFF